LDLLTFQNWLNMESTTLPSRGRKQEVMSTAYDDYYL